jgi:subtilase family serine protease
MRVFPVVLAATLLLPGCFFGAAGGGGGESGGSDGGPPQFDADLSISSLVFGPLNVDAGDSILVTDVVFNSGGEGVPSFRVGVYLSSDGTVTTTDTLLGFRTVPGLPAGGQDTGGGELTVPIQTTAGSYWVGAIADDLNQVGESSEDNNSTAATDNLQVDAPLLPDLVPTAVTFSPAIVDAGDQITINDVVENQGQANSGAFQVGLYLSSDSIITAADQLLGVRLIGDLPPANGDQGSGIVTVPSNTPAGIYFVGVLADDVDAVFEQNEGNNATIAGSTLQVTVPPLPDLVPTHVNFTPTAVDAGDQLLVSEGVLNQGVAPANTFQVAVYLSVDSLIDDNDVLLGFRSVAFLADGDSSDVSNFPLQVPAETAAGVYWVGVKADDTELIPESVEANNTLVGVSTLAVSVPPLPNLKPVKIEFSPTVVNVDEGDLLKITDVVENAGSAAASQFRVGVYLSPNAVLSVSDVLLSSRVVTALGPGGTSGSVKDVPLPAGISDGSYYVGVIVDDLSEQGEISEGDNLLLATGLLDVVSTPDPQPDLLMEDCTYSGNKKAPGATFQVVSKVTNEGTLSAGPFHVGIYLSVDNVIGPDDVLLGERFLLAGLASGFTNVASAPVTLPADQAEGIYYLGAFADNKLVVAELEEDDNDFTALGTLEVKVPPPPAPELYVKSSSHDTLTPEPGDEFTLTETLRNSGQLAAGTFRVGFYLSTDSDITTGDVLLGTRTLTGLGSESEDSASTLLTIPTDTDPGDYWIGVIVDDQFVVTENDEDDNFAKVQPQIAVQ